MRASNQVNSRRGLAMACAGLVVVLALGVAEGQVEREPQRASAREGGIPRKFAEDRDADRQEGLEEGTPDVQSRPGFKDALPRWRPPQGDWKLGVWAYNTDSGVVVTRVASNSPAERRGLERGDRIVSVGGYQVGYVGDLLYPLGYELRRQADGRGEVLLLVQNVRNKGLLNLTVPLDHPGGRVRPLPLERE